MAVVHCAAAAGDSRSVAVRVADLRHIQRQWRSLLDGVSAASLLHQLGPLHRCHRPVQLRAPNDASPGRADAGRRLDGVRLSFSHPNTLRSIHNSVTTRQTCRRQQRVLVQGLTFASTFIMPLCPPSWRLHNRWYTACLSVSSSVCVSAVQERKPLKSPECWNCIERVYSTPIHNISRLLIATKFCRVKRNNNDLQAVRLDLNFSLQIHTSRSRSGSYISTFITVLHGMQTPSSDENSVCPSVSLSQWGAQKRKVSEIWTISCDNSETVRGFRLVQTSMTLNDLEWRNNPYLRFVFSTEFDSFAGRLYHSGWRFIHSFIHSYSFNEPWQNA